MLGIRTSGTLMSAYTGAGGSPVNTWRSVTLPSPLQTNRWYHLAFSFDGGILSYYLDGDLIDTTTFSFGNNSVHTVKIGGYSTTADINGRKSDIRVWDHARSGAEIQGDQFKRLAGDESGLLGYWPLDEGVGASVVYDRTINGSHGTLVGARR